MFRLTGPDGSDFPGQARTLQEAARGQGGEFWFPASRPAVPRGPGPDTAGAPRSATASPGRSVGQVALLDPYLSLGALSDYASISVRQLRNLIADPVRPLPCYRIGGRVTVKRSDYDAWASQHRRVGVDVMGQIEKLQGRRRRRRVTHPAS